MFWGATGQAIVLNELLHSNGFTLSCLFDKSNQIESPVDGVPIFHTEPELFDFLKYYDVHYFSVAIGGNGGHHRMAIHEKLTAKGLFPATVFHPKSNIATDAIINEGSQILINATVCSRVKIGKQVIINSSASIDHESIINDGVHIGPGSVLSGCVEVGKCTFIGSGTVVLPRIKIGKNSVIGAASTVTKNIPDGVVAYGTPCKIMGKTNQKT